MLRILSKTKLCQGAKRVLLLMVRRKIELWPEDFGCVMVSFSRAGHISKALQVLNLMQRAWESKPNCVSYVALLNGLCRGGNSSEVIEMMNMSEGWWTPNSVTYSVILHGFRREGKLCEACDMVMEMIEKIYPSPVDINLLIQSLCRVDRTEQARKLMEECLKKVAYGNSFGKCSTYSAMGALV